ncbi:FAD-dependent thymidylate synthase [Alteromonas sp. RKMC-009]|uniref:FAD-dependent thymidylate synthase n=1 Tax=Alteromonas sp. RKMC-009 TaxID=2267264 RepID=UPI000E6855B7|nr:FAD-dependent thymidylate synthase [Alteromonas sp. RKMC-009]AYA64272.1 FAD-dependent thymidylate synthase [Alteromonas sp. RKMC-009]
MKAELITPISNDLLVVNAARVSMDKESKEFTYRKDKPKSSDEGLLNYLATHRHWTPFSHVRITMVSNSPIVDLDDIDPEDVASAAWRCDVGRYKFRTSLFGWAHLIRNGLITGYSICDVVHLLFREAPEAAKALLPEYEEGAYACRGHVWAPIGETDPAFIDVTMRETIPIFIARQRFKHMVGTTYNEVSRRYVDDTPEFYEIEEWRSRPDGSIKQGSGDVHPESDSMCATVGFRTINAAEEYDGHISDGFAPEQVRSTLPQSMLTSYYVTSSLKAWNRAYRQRIDSHAQKEIQDLAKQWNKILRRSEHRGLWLNLSS